jgi:hypothetical protein
MVDENLIQTLETSLRHTRNAQNRLIARLEEAENEVNQLRQEIQALENTAAQTELTIDSLLVELRGGSSAAVKKLRIDDEYEIGRAEAPSVSAFRNRNVADFNERAASVSYINQHRNVPTRLVNREPLSQRFSDRTITQSCTLLLREAGRPLHVNELYNLLVAGGMKFKGNNPTISIAVSLSRNARFKKVDPGTFDIVMREAGRKAS